MAQKKRPCPRCGSSNTRILTGMAAANYVKGKSERGLDAAAQKVSDFERQHGEDAGLLGIIGIAVHALAPLLSNKEAILDDRPIFVCQECGHDHVVRQSPTARAR